MGFLASGLVKVAYGSQFELSRETWHWLGPLELQVM